MVHCRRFTPRAVTRREMLAKTACGFGAVASLAYDDLRKLQNYVGTSMSSPSVAGVGALLVSAAKQSEVPHSPPRIRAALKSVVDGGEARTVDMGGSSTTGEFTDAIIRSLK